MTRQYCLQHVAGGWACLQATAASAMVHGEHALEAPQQNGRHRANVHCKDMAGGGQPGHGKGAEGAVRCWQIMGLYSGHDRCCCRWHRLGVGSVAGSGDTMQKQAEEG